MTSDAEVLKSPSVAGAADEIRQQGYAVIPGLYTGAELDALRVALDDLRERFGATSLTAKDPVWLADNVEVAGPGLAFYQLLGFAPSLASRLFKPDGVAALRAVLGDDMHLELVGAVMSDETRPFTEWESHLGGIDDERWRREGRRPRNTDVKRVIHFLFLEDLDDDTGPWRVLPRVVGDPVDPPASTREPDWPGQVTVTARAGSVLLLEESVWHAVVPRRLPGVRHFIGACFASVAAEPTVGQDASLAGLAGHGDPLFASLLEHRPKR